MQHPRPAMGDAASGHGRSGSVRQRTKRGVCLIAAPEDAPVYHPLSKAVGSLRKKGLGLVQSVALP